MQGRKRQHKLCLECGKNFSFLPRAKGQGQRQKCYKCQPRPKGIKPTK